MKRLLTLGTLTAFASLGLAQVPAAPANAPRPTPPPVTLKVGDAAPPLAVGSWLKGEAVPSLADGKVHVVEFWATWCGPCKSSMPHLSELAEKYRGKATFIGVNVWESRGPKRDYAADVAKATKFTRQAGRMMDYTVAMDGSDDTMSKTWMAAAGQNGIPASFLVDGKGTVLWIGHPQVGLDEAVGLAIDGKLTPETSKKLQADVQAKFNAFYALIPKYTAAMKANDYKAAYDYGDQAAKLLPAIPDPVEMKLDALVHSDRAAARKLAETATAEHDNAPMFLLSVAKTLMDEANPGATAEDYALGLKLAQKAADYVGTDDLSVLPTLALGYSKTGDKAKAVELQTKYVGIITDPALHAPTEFVDAAKAKLESFKGAAK